MTAVFYERPAVRVAEILRRGSYVGVPAQWPQPACEVSQVVGDLDHRALTAGLQPSMLSVVLPVGFPGKDVAWTERTLGERTRSRFSTITSGEASVAVTRQT